jgi:hypothetical protein
VRGRFGVFDNSCSSDAIEINVQPSFMESVRNQIPSSVNGVPTSLAEGKRLATNRAADMAIGRQELESLGSGDPPGSRYVL